MGHLITGAKGQAHITPKSDAVWHRGMMGVESCILDYGEKLAPALVPSQPTNIRILDGCGMMQGRFFEIEEGSYDTIAIPNGAQGYNRIDLVCAKITQNENGTQTFSWEVVQGTQTEGTPTPPTVEEHSLDDGDEFALMPIASVELEGVSIVAVETVAEIGRTVSDDIRKVVPLRENEFIEVKELLWENPNPSVAFPAQTVALMQSVSEFDKFQMDFRAGYSNYIEEDSSCFVGRCLMDSSFDFNASTFYLSRRCAEVSGNNLVFYDSVTWNANGGRQQGNNSWLIPLRLYGIKEV